MTRAFYMLFAAMVFIVLPAAGFAEGKPDCMLTCASEQNTRNIDCASPRNAATSGQARRQCMNNNQAAYRNCIKRCPAPPPSSSSDESASPMQTGY